jgi:alkyl sulfatase BDS1-like metallo-beta-lactamase superfamily hydrolase
MARDGYRYINDQTLRLANHGYTPNEVAETLQFPNELQQHWAMRGYYGSLYHNVKATYVKYLGWFDGNPSHLHVLPPVDAAKKYVEFMGGEDAVIEKAKKAYDRGEYRWVAEVMSHVVFANPNNAAAKQLNADALEQMGYQAESGPWRNFYLTGAKELRDGVMKLPAPNTASPDTVRSMSYDLFFDYLGMRLNGPKAAGKKITLNLVFPDTKDQFVLSLENGALNHTPNRQVTDADATVTIPRTILNNIVLGDTTLKNEIDSGKVTVQGKTESLNELVSMLDKFEFWFNIVTP